MAELGEAASDWVMELVKETLGDWLARGLAIHLQWQLPYAGGFGSSSALCLGLFAARPLLAAAREAQPQPVAVWQWADQAYQYQKSLQGFGSGYDVATQAHGSLVRFDPKHWQEGQPCTDIWEACSHHLSALRVLVGGKGARTGAVGSRTLDWLATQGQYPQLCRLTAEVVAEFEQGKTPIREIVPKIAQIRRLLQGAPDNPPALAQTLASLPGLDQSWTYKLSGAGGEDAVLLFGEGDQLSAASQRLQAQGFSLMPIGRRHPGMQVSWS